MFRSESLGRDFNGCFVVSVIESRIWWVAMAKKGVKAVTEVADDEVRVPLQAVVLADSFTQKFRPITLEKPKVRRTSSVVIELVGGW